MSSNLLDQTSNQVQTINEYQEQYLRTQLSRRRIPPDDHLLFVRRVLKREVSDFASLTLEEARQVWQASDYYQG
jgi:hypothetical protein